MLPPYAQDAKRLSLLFDFGVIAEREVIEWADSQIVALASPPDALMQLAVTPPNKTEDIITHLHTLGVEAEFCSAFTAALAQLHDHLVSHPADAERIAPDLFNTIYALQTDIPDEFRFVNRYDDAFDLAKSGVCGDTETLRKEFIDELQKFKPVV
ncbi:MAG: hypothetical protein JWR19_975 [Pedosphaera sp.]|nr:hypothetical protein [Pedosphaera sp.]